MSIEGGDMEKPRICIAFPMELPNPLNKREHWSGRAERTKAQRAKVRRQMPAIDLPVLIRVRLTRVAPRRLDDDGAVAAMKGVRDQVACWLGVDDKSALVRWDVAQERGEPGVRIEVEFAGMFGGVVLPGFHDAAPVVGAPTPNVRRAR